jgi:hypothetical protein
MEKLKELSKNREEASQHVFMPVYVTFLARMAFPAVSAEGLPITKLCSYRRNIPLTVGPSINGGVL